MPTETKKFLVQRLESEITRLEEDAKYLRAMFKNVENTRDYYLSDWFDLGKAALWYESLEMLRYYIRMIERRITATADTIERFKRLYFIYAEKEDHHDGS